MAVSVIAYSVEGVGPFTKEITVDSAGALAEAFRWASRTARGLTIRVTSGSITDMKLSWARKPGGDHVASFSGADFQTPDVDVPSITIVDASGVAITNFPTTAVPNGGAVDFQTGADAAEWVLWFQGVFTADISGTVA